VFPVSPDSAEAQVTWDGDCLLSR